MKKYIGSCFDVGYCRNTISKFFNDATEMAYYVGNYDENDDGFSVKIDEETFFNYVDSDSVPKKALKGKKLFYYIETLHKYPIENAAIFFIYNIDQDVHYFFK